MNAPVSWIREYTDLEGISVKELCDALTMSGSKVERWTCEADEIRNVVVGEVLEMHRHPDSDHLWVCSVNCGGSEPVQIVTGAQNVSTGDKVPCALDGALLPGGKTISSGKLRGEVSDGMMCSLGELGLTVHDFPDCIEDGIAILDPSAEPGSDICGVLGLDDTSIEFEITSNRPDCMCVSGLGREAAATFRKPFRFPEPQVRNASGSIEGMLSVKNETPENCLRYTAAIVKNVRVKPSPMWMRQRLRLCGVRPINNIVDITNYVMLEYNQPMHAFDYRNVKDSEIIIRQAREGEHIVTLDDIDRELTPDMMVIADSEKPIAVAGIMGGEYSGTYDDTNTVIFESACFNAVNVRYTEKGLGMKTESSVRFEKGLDPENTLRALTRALELVEELDAGDVISGFVDIKGNMPERRTLLLEPEKINAFLGTDLPAEEMVSILRSLEFEVSDDMKVTPPSFRADILLMNDIAEEIARFYGYNNVPSTVMTGVATAQLTERQHFEKDLAMRLVAAGLYEVKTYSFMGTRTLDLLNEPSDSELRKAVVISNPFGDDTALMRTTLLPSMLEVVSRNVNARVASGSFFEIGVTFHANEDTNELPDELKDLVIASYNSLGFYGVKGVVEDICRNANTEAPVFTALTDSHLYHPGRAATVCVGDTVIGTMGELLPSVAANFNIKEKVTVAILSVEKLFAVRGGVRRFTPLPKFPSMTRDLAVVCDTSVPSGDIEREIRIACGDILESISVFDVYTGDKIPEGKKSIAYSMVLRHKDRTMTDDEADAAIDRSLKRLAHIGASLRS
jgi:phenylalanyl-tRNA synthetase beta chain